MSGINIDIGKLAEPVTKLIEKVADAAGAIFEPFQMKRIAKAKHIIEKMEFIHQLKLNDLQKRAAQRFIHTETLLQNNIENIVAQSIPFLNRDSKPEEIQKD
ncbi:MAG: hypothetical protein AAFZ15_14685 [Bacteroidota bacterium]